MLCDIQPVSASRDSRLHFSLPCASNRAGGIAISEAQSAMRFKQNKKSSPSRENRICDCGKRCGTWCEHVWTLSKL